MKYRITILYNDDFLGDKNQSRGVSKSLSNLLRKKGQEVENEETKESEFQFEKTQKEKQIIITSGVHGFLKATEIKEIDEKSYIIWTGHQHFKELDTITHFPDIIALPKDTLSAEQETRFNKHCTFIRMHGVPHTVDEETVKDKAEKFTGEIPDLRNKLVVGIMLAGDAPDELGDPKFFTQEDAINKAHAIVANLSQQKKLHEDTLFLITNGPRTGKYDHAATTELNPNPHRAGAVDAVSSTFISGLKKQLTEKGLDESQVYFYDFQFADLKNGPSAYLPIMNAVCEHSGIFYFPSESTSMVTESEYVTSHGGEVIVYRPLSENKNHESHLNDCFSQGLIDVLLPDGSLKESAERQIQGSSASEAVANAAINQLCENSSGLVIAKDLLAAWQSKVSLKPHNEPSDTDESDPNFRLDRRAFQETLVFDKPPKVVLIKSTDDLEKISAADIPSLALSDDDQAVVYAKAKTLTRNDPQLLLKACLYDKEKNILYIQLVRSDYAFLNCLSNEKFDEDSPIYHAGITKTGVLAPFVTADGATYLFERTNEKKRGLKLTVGLHSVAGGFLDPNIKRSDRDLISFNAEKEALEEVLGDSEGNPRHDVSISNIQVWGISFRYFAHTKETTVPPLATLEFVCPTFLAHDSASFEDSVLKRNIAKDLHEHELNVAESDEGYSALKYVKLDLNTDIIDQPAANNYPGVERQLSFPAGDNYVFRFYKLSINIALPSRG